MAQADYFLKIDGIQGESQDDKHKDEIELDSFSWGTENAGSSHLGGGAGAGKARLRDLVIMKHVDKASPKLMEACATGKHISSVVLTCRKAGGGQQDYMKITLSDVVTSGYHTQGGKTFEDQWNFPQHIADGNITRADSSALPADSLLPLEQISFNFGKIEWEYREQDSKGNVKGPVKHGWDAKQNKSV